jgi:PBP1b-binding outer membrane lipoprotein LpoB
MNKQTLHRLLAVTCLAILASGCNNVDRSKTKGPDSTPDAQNARDPQPIKNSTDAASAAQGEPKP